ncbi:MAG: hypothetical protein ACR2LL_06285 [Nitrosopumilus sp.]
MAKDQGGPTCSSKDLGNLEVRKNHDGIVIWKNQCYNCKKF